MTEMKNNQEKTTYWEKLKDPRWQKKRLEVLKIYNFTCNACGDTESTLHIHHPFYKKNTDPWDYDYRQLMCLCEKCHKEAHDHEAKFDELANLLKSAYFRPFGLRFVTGFMAAYIHDGPFDFPLYDSDYISGVAMFFGMEPEEVEALAVNGVIPESIFYEKCVQRLINN